MVIRSLRGNFNVTGSEKHNIRGKVVDLCCTEISEEAKQKWKFAAQVIMNIAWFGW